LDTVNLFLIAWLIIIAPSIPFVVNRTEVAPSIQFIINYMELCKATACRAISFMPNTFTYLSQVYFDELDGLGLLHHTRYLLHLERAQQNFFEHLLGVDDFNVERDEDIYVVVHSLTARFRQPVSNPGPLAINYTIQKIRGGGVTMGYTVSCPEAGTVFCEGERTVCKLSAETHQPAPWSEPFRVAMESFQAAT